MRHIGNTKDGRSLMGRIEKDVQCYYLDGSLVAIAFGELGETGFTDYACLDGIWDANAQTSIVSESELLRIAGKPAVSVA